MIVVYFLKANNHIGYKDVHEDKNIYIAPLTIKVCCH